MKSLPMMRSKDFRSLERGFKKIERHERWKNGAVTLAITWVKGMMVIAEMVLILIVLYYFNTWLFRQPSKTQMRVLWGILGFLLIVVLPILLGGAVNIVRRVSNYVKEIAK
jgi:hypothetical protein